MTDTERTRFAARILGPLMVIVGAIVIVRFNALILIIPAILADGALAFVTGIFTLICGIVLFAAHHHWKGAAAFVISLLALLTILRGIILMFAPNAVAGVAAQFFHLGPGALIAGAVALIIGAWLTFVGWFAKSAS
jgi:hypothetical protein